MIGRYLTLLNLGRIGFAAGLALGLLDAMIPVAAPPAVKVTTISLWNDFLPGVTHTSIRASFDQLPAGLDHMSTGSVPTGVLGSVAFPFSPVGLSRWQNMQPALKRLSIQACGDNTACRTRTKIIKETVTAVTGASLFSKIEAINKAVNKSIRYETDGDIYGQLDYWATPAETMTTGRGDCEDYAILKLAALRSAGIPADSLALVVVRDVERNFFHAVLAVSTNNRTYILDNLRNSVLPDSALPQYQALYSLGAQRAWVHGYKRGSAFAMQKRPASLEAVLPGEGVSNPS